MAAMVLKDMIICPRCGAEMFPCAFDGDNRLISYRCRSCYDVMSLGSIQE